MAVAIAGCTSTSVHPAAPGEPESATELVVTYYYLNF